MELLKNETNKPFLGFASCYDKSGGQHNHGDYFSLEYSSCTRCLCDNGKPAQCIALQCQVPKCKNYEQIPGKCCEYTCPRDFVLTDKSTVAVVVSLSIILIVILVAITMVWRKIRRKEKYHKRLETESTGSSQQETDLESLIQQHSIPNNLRNSTHSHGHTHEQNSSSTSPLLTEHDAPTSSTSGSHSSLPDQNFKNHRFQNSTNKLMNNSSTRNNTSISKTAISTNQDGSHTKLTNDGSLHHQHHLHNQQQGNYSKTIVNIPNRNELHFAEHSVSIQPNTKGKLPHAQNNDRMKNSSRSHADGSYNINNQNCSQQVGRFEPPPPYSPLNGRGGAFV